MMDEKNIKMEISHGYQGEVYWDQNQIQQVMMNLIQNSIDAIKSDGEIRIATEYVNDEIIISVSDNGEGIAEDKLNKIFNLYYTTKAKGTGIGLSLVQKIIYEHGGLVNLESEKNAGTKIMIKLPKRYKDIQ
ncbi:sensor protein ZraS [bacterium BMS3Abin04]|nr:sensor protein ZraS [bacterium BMS3Abin04]